MTYKGYLQKTQEGWGVLSNLRNEAIPLYDYIDPNLLFYNGRKVEFEVLQIDDWFAKLVWQERDKPHAEKLAEEVYGKGVKEDYEEGFVDGYNKAKENYEVTSSIRELHQYKLGLKDGYNKAKETLYTEEQVKEVIEMAYVFGQAGHFAGEGDLCIKEIIQSLKLK